MDDLLHRLLAIGRTGDYAEISGIPNLQDHRSVLRLADVNRDKVIGFAKKLSNIDRIAFLKCIAMVEHSVGTMGMPSIDTNTAFKSKKVNVVENEKIEIAPTS